MSNKICLCCLSEVKGLLTCTKCIYLYSLYHHHYKFTTTIITITITTTIFTITITIPIIITTTIFTITITITTTIFTIITHFLGRTARYCGKACQVQHWPVHKNICVDSNSEDSNDKLEKKAKNYFEQGQLGKAEQLYRRLLKSLNKTTVKDGNETHAIEIIKTMDYLADITYKQGRLHEAENLFRETLERSSRLLGKSHPWTILVTKNLARALDALGRYDEAVSLFQACLSMVSPDDPLMLDVQSDLACCYTNQNELVLATYLLVKIVEKKSATLGEGHHETNTARSNLAGVYMRMGQSDETYNTEAEVLFKTSIRHLKDSIGDTHSDYLYTSSRLGGLYISMGRYAEAVSLLEDILEKQKRILGYTKETLQTMSNLSVGYERMDNHDMARELREICLEKQKLLGGTEDDPMTLTMMLNHTNSIFHLGRYEEAEKMYSRIIQRMIPVLGERHPNVQTTMFGLLRAYRKLDKDDEARKLQRRMDLLFG